MSTIFLPFSSTIDLVVKSFSHARCKWHRTRDRINRAMDEGNGRDLDANCQALPRIRRSRSRETRSRRELIFLDKITARRVCCRSLLPSALFHPTDHIMPAVTIERSSDESVLTMAWHDLFAIWFQGPLTVANQREAEQHARKCIDQWSRGIGMMIVINEAMPPPSNEVRPELNAIFGRIGSSLRGVAYVVHGKGFNAMMARSTLTASTWLARRPYPMSTSSDLTKGAKWLHYTLGEDPERGSVEQFVQALAAASRGEEPQTLRTKKQ